MSLTVKKTITRYIPRIILTLILIAASAFIVHVAIFESKYYREKEGSTRATAAIVGDIASSEAEPSSEPITPVQVKEYLVPADQPRYLTINKLGIVNARIISVGVDKKGQMQTPNSIYDAAWYNRSAKPGKGYTGIYNGHSGVGGSSGIFRNLSALTAGDLIKIELGNGTIHTYRVYDNFEVKLEDANKKMKLLTTSPVEGEESISIITCTGEYSLKQKTYLSRQFLRATKIN